MAAPCTQCAESIAETAAKCPHCGYHPAGDKKRRATYSAIIGTVLSVTVIGLVIGIPLIIYAWWLMHTARSARPTD